MGAHGFHSTRLAAWCDGATRRQDGLKVARQAVKRGTAGQTSPATRKHVTAAQALPNFSFSRPHSSSRRSRPWLQFNTVLQSQIPLAHFYQVRTCRSTILSAIAVLVWASKRATG